MDNNKGWWGRETGTSYVAGGIVKWCSAFGKHASSKCSTHDPAIPLLRIYPRELKPCMHTDTRTQMFTVASFIRTNKWKQFQCLSTDVWISEAWCTHSMEYELAIKSNAVLIHAVTWTDLENIMLRKSSQWQKPTYFMIPFIWNLQMRQVHRQK